MSDPSPPAPDTPPGTGPVSEAPTSADQFHSSSASRQRIVRTGRRRAVLTPAPGSDPDPFEPDFTDPDAPAPENTGPNDARMRQDVPPHY